MNSSAFEQKIRFKDRFLSIDTFERRLWLRTKTCDMQQKKVTMKKSLKNLQHLNVEKQFLSKQPLK